MRLTPKLTSISVRLFVAFALVFAGCRDVQKEKQALIQKEVKITVESYRARRRAECMATVYEKANKMADSIIMTRANLAVDSATLIKKPEKPVKPDFKIPLDSAPVRPLFKK